MARRLSVFAALLVFAAADDRCGALRSAAGASCSAFGERSRLCTLAWEEANTRCPSYGIQSEELVQIFEGVANKEVVAEPGAHKFSAMRKQCLAVVDILELEEASEQAAENAAGREEVSANKDDADEEGKEEPGKGAAQKPKRARCSSAAAASAFMFLGEGASEVMCSQGSATLGAALDACDGSPHEALCPATHRLKANADNLHCLGKKCNVNDIATCCEPRMKSLHHDAGFSSRCKSVVSGGITAGGNPCHLGCVCSTPDNPPENPALSRCEMCSFFGQRMQDIVREDMFNGSSAVQQNWYKRFQKLQKKVKEATKEIEGDNGDKTLERMNAIQSFGVENNATTNFCPDGAVTPKGFWVSRGHIGQGSAGWCQTWEEAASMSAEPTWCNIISHSEKVCSKMLVTHPQLTHSSVGSLVAKRMHCKGNVCSVTKVGLCIDVKKPIFVLEACEEGHEMHQMATDSGACTACTDTSAECQVNNDFLSENTGAKAVTVKALGIDGEKLSQKNMRINFVQAAIEKLKALKGKPIPMDWEYACTGTASERAEVLMKLQ